MTNWRVGARSIAGMAVALVLASCSEEEDTLPLAPAPATAAGEAIVPAVEPVDKPLPTNALGDKLLWSATAGGTVDYRGYHGTAQLTANSILSIVADKAPVTAGQTIKVTAVLTAPAGRAFRLYAMRHCGSPDADDVTTADFVGSGKPTPLEVSHTFKAGYDCMRLSLTAGDKLPMHVALSDIAFLKMDAQ